MTRRHRRGGPRDGTLPLRLDVRAISDTQAWKAAT